MIAYNEFERLMNDVSECADFEAYAAECGGSVPLDDVDKTMWLLNAIWELAHDPTIKTLAKIYGAPIRKMAEELHIPQRTIENWTAGKGTPEWAKMQMFYAVMSIAFEAQGEAQ